MNINNTEEMFDILTNMEAKELFLLIQMAIITLKRKYGCTLREIIKDIKKCQKFVESRNKEGK